MQSASLWQVFIGGSQFVVAVAQNAGTPPVPDPAAPPLDAPPLPTFPPAPNAPPQTKQTSRPPAPVMAPVETDPALPPEATDPPLPPKDSVPAALPDDNDPAAPPVPLFPAEPPVAVVDPSSPFVDDEPELDEQAIAAPKSSEMTVHRPAVRVPRAPLILRPQATSGPPREHVFPSTYNRRLAHLCH